jgi:PKD repeat protein
MTSIFQRIVICSLLLLFIGGAAVSAEEATQLLPMFLTGTLYIGDNIAPPGTVVYADIVGIDGGFATVMSNGVYGNSSYPMMVQVGANETLRGSPVTFWVNGVQAEETTTYQDGLTLALDLHVSGAAQHKLSVVPRGGDVFIGEEGLDVSLFIRPGETIGWWSSASNLNTDSPAATVVVTTPKGFFINPAQFVGKTGNWYIVDGSVKNPDKPDLIVQEPSIALRIWNQNENQDIDKNGGRIPVGNFVNFQIESNIYPVISQRGSGLPAEDLGIINLIGSSNVTKVTYQSLRGSLDSIPDKDISLRNLIVDTNKWFWPQNDRVNSGWNTGAIATDGNRLYPNGEYLFKAEVNLNNIIKNYPHVGKAFSQDIPSTIVDDSIDVTIDVGTVFRNSTFFVTVGGRPGKDYIISIMECPPGASEVRQCGVLKMTGAACDRPPMIRPDQSGVSEGKIVFDSEEGPFFIGETELAPDCCGRPGIIRSTVPTDDKPNAKDVLNNGVYYYAQITTDGDNDPTPGYRTVEFNVGSDVAPDRPYRIHVQSVEADPAAMVTGDGMITVNKGTVTLEVVEQPPFYLGDSITLRGTNTDSKYVYLFMTGSNCQNKCGNDLLYIRKADPANRVIQPFIESITYGCIEEASQFTAIEVPVKGDGTWEYVWKTANVPINPGTYTVHASSIPINACCIECTCAAIATADITLEEPCFDATIDPSIITRPIECCPEGCKVTSLDTVILEGMACGFPHTGSGLNTTNELNMWIFGEEKVGNYKYINARIPVFNDDSFKVNLLDYLEFCDLKPGTYTVILQHPMYNHKFDLLKETDVRSPVDPNQIWMVTSYPVEWSKLFPLDGPGYYQGSQAVNELKKFEQQRLIDDKFFYLTFTIVDDRVPTAAFTAAPLSGNKPLEVQFTDQSTGEGLTSWSWSFGDKTTSTEQNPKKTYSEAGVYSVTLEVLNSNGERDATTKPDYINVRDALIKADFIGSPTSGAAPLKVQFTDKSTGSPNNWFWDFGDGFTSAGVQNPSHSYQFGGKYTVTLSITLGEEVDRMVKKDYITVVGGPQPTHTPSPLDPTKIQLYSGWNFISVARPLADAYANASVVFRNVPTGGHAIWSYDPYGQFWDQVLTNTKIEPLFGYWIYSVSANTINLTFKNDPVSIPAQRSLPPGWAAVGFTGATPATAKDTFSSVKNSWIYARGFDNARQQWEPTLVNGGQGENTYLYPSKGYWLYMETAGTLAAIGV